MPTSILVATAQSFTPASSRAFDFALTLAKVMKSSVRVLACYPRPSDLYYEAEGSTDFERATKAALERILSPLAGVAIETATFGGTPTQGILAHAEEAGTGLIVMATHEKGLVERMLSGSVAQEVVRLAHCPVVTVADAAIG